MTNRSPAQVLDRQKKSQQNAMMLVVASTLLLLSCQSKKPDKTAGLEEAPAEIAAGLEPLPNTVLLATSKTVKVEPPKVDSSKAGHGQPPARACADTTVLWVQVEYPITVCYPPDISQGIESANSPQAGSGITTRQSGDSVHEYKLSSLAGKRFVSSLFCKATSGPWIAEVTEVIQCSEAIWFDLRILGIGQNVHYSWSGSFNNAPAELHIIGEPVFRSSSRSPCSGLTQCQ